MTMRDQTLAALESVATRRTARRSFIKAAAGASALVGGLSVLAACDDDDDNGGATPTPSPSSAISEVDALNFALQLEYLEASFYSYAAFGTGLPANLTSGSGTLGTVANAGTATGPRRVDFSGDLLIGQYAREIAYDEIAHVSVIRAALTSATAASFVAMPAINITGPGGAFAAAATAAGIANAATFDPYANVNNFLLSAYLFEDVGPTAYMGAVPSLTTAAVIDAAAGIHAAEAYHAAIIRTILWRRGVDASAIFTAATQISTARDSLDGSTKLDEDIGNATTANIVSADANAVTYVRTPQQVLNVVYLQSGAGRTSGGFFPSGLNGTVRTS